MQAYFHRCALRQTNMLPFKVFQEKRARRKLKVSLEDAPLVAAFVHISTSSSNNVIFEHVQIPEKNICEGVDWREASDKLLLLKQFQKSNRSSAVGIFKALCYIACFVCVEKRDMMASEQHRNGRDTVTEIRKKKQQFLV